MTRRNILEAFVGNVQRMNKGEHSDEEIKRALLAIYTREPWAPLDHLNLCVKDGVVEITGSVERESQRKAVVAAAEGIPGVKAVIDMMNNASVTDIHSGPTRSFVDGQYESESDDQQGKT